MTICAFRTLPDLLNRYIPPKLFIFLDLTSHFVDMLSTL